MRLTKLYLPVAAAATLLLAATNGCAHERRATPEPAPDLPGFVAGVALPGSAYRLIGDGASRGRFAYGLAIARLNPSSTPPGPDQLVPIREIEQAYWQEAFRGIPAVRDLQFLTPIDERRAASNAKDLCQAACHNGAEMLLIYSAATFPVNSARVVGVIFDATTAVAVAAVQAADAIPLPDDVEELNEETGDRREIDASFQVSRRFERFTRECVLALEQRNPPPAATQPHHWKPEPIRVWEPAVLTPR